MPIRRVTRVFTTRGVQFVEAPQKWTEEDVFRTIVKNEEPIGKISTFKVEKRDYPVYEATCPHCMRSYMAVTPLDFLRVHPKSEWPRLIQQAEKETLEEAQEWLALHHNLHYGSIDAKAKALAGLKRFQHNEDMLGFFMEPTGT